MTKLRVRARGRKRAQPWRFPEPRRISRVACRMPSSPDHPTHPEPAGPDDALRLALAQKVLEGWAQNSQQVMVPLALNLARMDAGQRAPILGLMQGALLACGVPEADRHARLAAALARIGGEDAPPIAPDLLATIRAIEERKLGAHGYAAAAMVLDNRVAVERAFLAWLAARFSLARSVIAGLMRRYRR
jgi:hypothetical protein